MVVADGAEVDGLGGEAVAAGGDAEAAPGVDGHGGGLGQGRLPGFAAFGGVEAGEDERFAVLPAGEGHRVGDEGGFAAFAVGAGLAGQPRPALIACDEDAGGVEVYEQAEDFAGKAGVAAEDAVYFRVYVVSPVLGEHLAYYGIGPWRVHPEAAAVAV